MATAYVYPAFDARYYGHYFDAIRALLGPRAIHFTRTGFPAFGTDCLALRLMGDVEHRIYIHSNDWPDLAPDGLEWCDTFGKVNLDPATLADLPAKLAAKVVAIGPTFPFRTATPLALTIRGLKTYLLSSGRSQPFRRHMATYRGLYVFRFPEEEYLPHPSRRDYVFFNASVWEREPEANAVRARFMDAARSVPGIEFEGGLTPRSSARGTPGWSAPGLEPYLVRRYDPREYLEKTRQSAVVLNNPAYRDCHSWRLAEALALGKAIVSTPIRRAVPAPLLHGMHLHLVDGSVESFRGAIELLCSDDRYREHLERGARIYYEHHLHPRKVITRLIDHPNPALHADSSSIITGETTAEAWFHD
jgi:hypothetical protein